ncbi:hypothetical protein ACN20G_28035 (plasmid) [Streptomyces sp. BI20]|uniref:hypothetical protein n=1 Tax=Streptomyces sp. BI20 TaxID=3403460 RepID=UPI003C77586A
MLNLRKTPCRFDDCTNTGSSLVFDGVCAYLLCPRHTDRAAAYCARQGWEAWIVPAAEASPRT